MVKQVLCMMVKSSLWLMLGLSFSLALKAQQSQPCTGLGQTPQTAFPVCGTTTFVQETVPPCGSKEIPVPGCSGQGTQYTDLNPYWYKFTCYKSGTLGFTITPNNLGDDYDWQIFDITGHDPSEIFTNPALFVAGNWAGTYGITGASGTATGNIQCASYPPDNVPTFSHWPTLIKGHQYLLIVSHFTSDNQSGYKLSFNGGSASITDTVQPHLKSVVVSCDSKELFVQLNKKMKCLSIASDGSDFKIGSGSSNVISASGYNCNSGFDMDSLHLVLDQPLPPGQYSLIAKIGTDNNTLLDNCDTPIPDGEQINFEIFPLQPTPMDSVQPLNCKADFIRLIFKKSIQCNSIAADGSDFSLTGPGNISITGASGSCNSGKTDYIDIHLSSPIYAAGNFQIQLKTGIDGNTIIDECGQETPAGATIAVQSADTVSAAINYQVHWGCLQDSIFFQNNGGISITSWSWAFQDMSPSNLQNPMIIYSEFGDKNIQLVVSNGVCSDSAETVVSLDNALKAAFETQALLCPTDKSSFVNRSSGHIVGWLWNFGDGTSDTNETPHDHFFPNNPLSDKSYPVTLVVTDNLGCTDTTTSIVKKLHSCIIAVPNAFTPNGDGINDYLYPLNGFKADNLIFRVYNRYGQLIFETTDWTRKWDGTLGGKPQGTGTYVWTLQYTDRDTGQRVVQKGSSVLIR